MKCPRRQHENHSGPRFCEEWGDRVHAHRLGTAAELLEAEVFERVRLDAVEAFERIRRHEKLAPEVAGRPFDGAVVFITSPWKTIARRLSPTSPAMTGPAWSAARNRGPRRSRGRNPGRPS